MTLQHPRTTCLLTGSTGFVGSAVLAALGDEQVLVKRLVRSPAATGPGTIVAGLEDRDTVSSAAIDCTALIHCASYIGPDEAQQRTVNVDGTRAVVESAERASVPRIVYLSTTGVYGSVLGSGLAEGEIAIDPRSSLSRSRRDAEELVLDADGIVVRPHIVYGPGDRHTIAALLRAMVRADAWIGDPDARISAIPVDDLGQLIARLAVGTPGPAARIYHAALPRPVRIADLVLPVYAACGAPPPTRRITIAHAQSLFASVSARQFAMVATDNWYDCGRVWRATRLEAPRTAMSPTTIAYYAGVLDAELTSR